MTKPEMVWKTAYRHPGEWDRSYALRSMVDLFEESAAAHPHAPLLDFMGRIYSYGETLDGANRVAYRAADVLAYVESKRVQADARVAA